MHRSFKLDWEVAFGGFDRYRLFGVIYHLGGYQLGGHYVFRYRGSDGSVYHYDGMVHEGMCKKLTAQVDGTSNESLMSSELPEDEYGENQAVLLFYTKIN